MESCTLLRVRMRAPFITRSDRIRVLRVSGQKVGFVIVQRYGSQLGSLGPAAFSTAHSPVGRSKPRAWTPLTE